jgi:hypothetical protein
MKTVTLNRLAAMTGAALLLWVTTTPTHALIFGQVIANPDGSYTYSYQIDPQGRIVTNWGLDFDLPGADWDLTGVSVPDGWIADWAVATGQPDLDFLDVTGSGVGPDLGLTGFSFISFFAPGLIDFFEFGILTDETNSDYGAEGSVIGPMIASTPVPDALSVWASCLTFGLLLACHARSQGRRRSPLSALP